MENIAILTGGDSAEYNISILSAKTVLSNLSNKYKGYIINLKKNVFTVITNTNSIPVDTKDFSFIYEGNRIKIKKVFMALHGPPAENGIIQKYFDKLNIKYTSCNSSISELTFHKYNCNNKLRNLGFKCANSYLYSYNKEISSTNILHKINLPCFVKPNAAGSSYGVSKVKKEENLKKAIKNALLYDKEVIIEEALKCIPNDRSKKILDVGTGSGCIIISLLKERNNESEQKFIDCLLVSKKADDMGDTICQLYAWVITLEGKSLELPLPHKVSS